MGETWGRRDGDNRLGYMYPDFLTMQQRISEGYGIYLKSTTNPGMRPTGLAPVGSAYKLIYDAIVEDGKDPTEPGSDFHILYTNDGSHPSSAGSYLGACVLYACV